MKTFGFTIRKFTTDPYPYQVADCNIDKAVEAGAQIIRIPIDVRDIHPQHTNFFYNSSSADWSIPDYYHTKAVEAGLEIHFLLVVFYQPPLDEWAELVEDTFTRYPDVNTYSVGNEVESQRKWGIGLDNNGDLIEYAEDQFDLAAATYINTINTINPEIIQSMTDQKVVCSSFMGSTVSSYISSAGVNDYKTEVVDRILQARENDPELFDILDIHIYGKPNIAIDIANEWKSWLQERNLQNVPWWVTETGGPRPIEAWQGLDYSVVIDRDDYRDLQFRAVVQRMMQTFVLGDEKVFWWSNNDRWPVSNQPPPQRVSWAKGLYKRDDPYDPKPSMGIYKFLVERIVDGGQIISLNTPHSNVIALEGPNVNDSNTVILAFYKIVDDDYTVKVQLGNLGTVSLISITPNSEIAEPGAGEFLNNDLTVTGEYLQFLTITVKPLLLIANINHSLSWQSDYPAEPIEPGPDDPGSPE